MLQLTRRFYLQLEDAQQAVLSVHSWQVKLLYGDTLNPNSTLQCFI